MTLTIYHTAHEVIEYLILGLSGARSPMSSFLLRGIAAIAASLRDSTFIHRDRNVEQVCYFSL